MTVHLALGRPDLRWVGRVAPLATPPARWWARLSVALRRPSAGEAATTGRAARPLTAPHRSLRAPGGRAVDPDDERALVERARQDRGAFGELYRRHVQAVFGYAFRLTGSRSAAEDITSATFERALRNIGSYQWQGAGVRPWLLRIAANEANDHHRRQRRAEAPVVQRAMRDLSLADRSGVSAGDRPFAQVDLDAVRAALTTLPERYRDVISLRYLAGMDAEQAAVALGCSKATLAVTLHRALGALRRAMSADTVSIVARGDRR